MVDVIQVNRKNDTIFTVCNSNKAVLPAGSGSAERWWRDPAGRSENSLWEKKFATAVFISNIM